MTNDLDKEEEPDTLFIGAKSYPIHCTYENAQSYDEAISTNTPLKDTAYKASEYFYHHYTPQINYILTCQAETDLNTDKTSMQISDTYPWYQPIATGSKNELAAGDALAYVDKDQVIFVLGHEPCACNKQSAKNCDQLKETTRGFKEHIWPLVADFQKDKLKYPPKAQQDIQSFTNWTKNEIQKDFCFIDRDEIISRLSDTLSAIKKDVPEGWTLPQDNNLPSQ
jgi:hypothetical protein